MSLADQLGSVDPQGVVTSLLADQAPDLVQNSNVDPQSVLNNLIRKGLDQRQQRKLQEQQSQPQSTDFSTFGKTKEEVDAQPQEDFSQFGQETPEEAPAQPVGGALSVGARSAAQAVPAMVGEAIQGAPRTLSGLTPSMVQTAGGEGAPSSVEDLTPPPSEAAENNPALAPIVKAGKTVSDWGKQTFPVSEAERAAHPIAAGVGAGLGTVGSIVGLGILSPEAGLAGAAALFGFSSAENTYEEAIKKGADPDTANKAAVLSSAANAALGSLPIANVLLPFKTFMPAATGYAMRILARAAENGIVFATIGEAQEYIGQQIAKSYDPKAGYSPDANRLIASLLTGAIIGGAHEAISGRGEQPPPQDPPNGNPPGAPGALPGPGGPGAAGQGGGGPGPQPGRAGAGAAEPAAPFETSLNPKTRANMERSAGYYKDASPEDIASWSDDKLKDYLNTKFGFGSQGGDVEGAANAVAEEMPGDGSRDAPIDLKTPADLAHAVAVSDTSSTHEQGAANNAPRVHVTWNDIPITIETAGPNNVRRGTDDKGAPWEQPMGAPSGYIKGVPGADGDQVDVSIGPHPSSPTVYVIDEKHNETGEFRQHKAFIGMQTPAEAYQAYTATQGKSPAGVGGMRALSVPEFKEWLKNGDTKAAMSDAMRTPAEAPTKAPQSPSSPVEAGPEHVQAVEAPTAEPISDLKAQSKSLAEKDNPRTAVWLPVASVDHLRSHGELEAVIGKNQKVENFDGNGGMLVVPDQDTAKTAIAARDKGEPIQKIVGRMTGAGAGKPINGTHMVQQLDKDGNVTRESFVPAADIEKTQKEFSAGGKNVRVVTPQEALQRRADLVGRDGAGASPEHVQAVEGALRAAGVDPVHARPADVARAAEIHATEGAPAADAFPVAVVRNLVDDGHMTRAQVEEAVGKNEAKDILEPSHGVERGARAETPSPAARGPAAEAAGKLGEVGADNGAAPSGTENAESAVGKKPAGHEAAGEHGETVAAGHTADRGSSADNAAGGERPAAGGKGGAEREPTERAGEQVAAHGKNAEAATGAVSNKVAKRRASADAMMAKKNEHVREELRTALKEAKIPLDMIPAVVENRAIAIMVREKAHPLNAIEDAQTQIDRENNDVPEQTLLDLGVPKETINALNEHAASGAGEGTKAEGTEVSKGRGGENAQVGGGALGAGEGAGREPAPVAEPGPAAGGPESERAGGAEREPAESEQHGEPAADHELEVGKPEQVKPVKTKKEKAEEPAAETKWTKIGKNAEGKVLYEDKRGVRSYVEDGVRITEAVPIIPTRAGVEAATPVHKDEWQLASEQEETQTPAEKVGMLEAAQRNLPDAFADHFQNGKAFPNIIAARKFSKDLGHTTDPKQVEEALELGVVKTARTIVANGGTPQEIYKALVNLYGLQPKLGTRTSTSMREQAYSTPMPLAYLASKLAGITKETTVFEPTAGNGALLIDANPYKTIANEINPTRADNLKSQDYPAVTSKDATEIKLKPTMDVVIANPPFGAVKENGESRVFDLGDIQPGYRTHEIDHVIALRALGAMRDDGRAVLILGGLNKMLTSREARSDGYNGKAKREFFKILYDNYNVTDHFTVSGDLYERQGAGWPVDVIAIEGRGKSAKALPAVDVPRIYNSWDNLEGVLDGLRTARGNEAGVGGRDVGAAGEAVTAGPGTGHAESTKPAGGRGVRSGRAEHAEPASVQPSPVSGGRPTEAGAERNPNGPQAVGNGKPGGSSAEASSERRPPGLVDFKKSFDAALDKAFGSQVEPKSFVERASDMGATAFANGIKAAPALDRAFKELLREANPTGEIGRGDTIKMLDAWNKAWHKANAAAPVEPIVNEHAEKLKKLLANPKLPTSQRGEIEKQLNDLAKDERSTADVAQSAADNAIAAADDAFHALYKLFGGGEPMLGMGAKFDPETYAKAKPEFIKAAGRFSEFWNDLQELLDRMVAHMRDALKWPREVFEKLGPYFQRFMDELAQGIVRLGPKAEEPVRPKKAGTKADAETAGQVTYVPESKTPGLGTLVPINMRRSIADSLAALSKRVGDIDDYVANELGYKKAELEDYFGAEQVDALALAIDNINRGKGFIIGDQTGIGKGRVNAAIIRWAIKNNRIPIFVTKGPTLYADMYRDLQDIGISDGFLKGEPRILATNTGLKLPLNDAGTVTISNGDSKNHAALMGSVLNPDEFRKKYDMVFTTYAQMQTVAGEDTARRQFIKTLAPNAVAIFDESHEAGGQKQGRVVKGAPANRSGFARDLVKNANGVFYSSATYAKRPDVMDLYAATDMAMAVDKIEDLAEAIQRGGVPMQQVVAAMLAEGGQYIRRERSFAGVTYDTPLVPVSREKYDSISHALDNIQKFSERVKDAADAVAESIKAEAGATAHDNATGSVGASSTNFTAIMHNVINQMLLAMKAQPGAEMAIAALKRGEKPVLTVANTMESFLDDYTKAMDIREGQPVPADFADVLQKYLDRTRTITIKKAFGKKEDTVRHILTDAELGTFGVNAYREAKDFISRLELSDLPMSPIDHMKNQITSAGYKVGEITGRSMIVDYSGDEPILRSRPTREVSIRGRRETNSNFNNGALDAIILNQAGSTGISLHASERFKDQRQRHMMIVQPEGNIDTHMQMLGRVHRTGQIVVPKYSQLVADIPAEKRPAAVLAKKMASLNANTTASRSGALTAKDVPDFINDYGDSVAVNYLHDNPEMNYRLAGAVKRSEGGKLEKPDAMRKLTGRIPLLPLAQQEELYDHLESEYDALLKQMDAAGENALEAKTLDLKAQPIERSEVVPAKAGSTSPFAAPVHIEKVSVARLGKPFKPEEVVKKVLTELGADDAAIERVTAENAAKILEGVGNEYGDIWGSKAVKQLNESRQKGVDDFNSYMRPIIDEIADPEKAEKERTKLNAVKDRWTTMRDLLPVGKRVVLKTSNGNLTGVVLTVEHKGKPKNPLALSAWKAHFALADAQRQITLPFSRLWPDGKSDPEDDLAIEVGEIPHWVEDTKRTLDRFASMQSEAREVRYIATGNMLAAYDWLSHKGRIINYTDAKGTIQQGILTGKDFDLDKHAIQKGRGINDPAEIKTWLDANAPKSLWTKDNTLRISKTYQGYTIAADKKKSTGGIFYLDKDLTKITGDFYSRGGLMQTDVSDRGLPLAIKRIQALGGMFMAPAGAPKATKVEQPQGPAAAMAMPPVPHSFQTSRGLSDQAEQQRLAEAARRRAPLERQNPQTRLTPLAQPHAQEIAARIYDIINRLTGGQVRVGFDRTLSSGGSVGWGSVKASTAGGLYLPLENTIKIALGDPRFTNMPSVAFHEAFHAIEDHFLNDQEMGLLKREDPRLRKIAQQAFGFTDAEAEQLADFEVRAIAFQTYAGDRARGGNGTGMHIGVRAIFEKLLRIFRQIANYLRGLGFNTPESIFEKAYQGEMGERPSRKPEEGSRVADSIVREQEKAAPPAVAAESAKPPLGAAMARPLGGGPPGRGHNQGPPLGSGKHPADWAIRRKISDFLHSDSMLTLKEKIQDFNARVERLQNIVEARYRGWASNDPEDSLPDNQRFYDLKRLFPGKRHYQQEIFQKQHLLPLDKFMRDKGISKEAAGDYLYAKHAPERNMNIGALHPYDHDFNKAMRDPTMVGASGMSTQEAHDIVAKFENGPKAAAFKELAKRVAAIRQFNQGQMLRGHLESLETLADWNRTSPNYVPLRGWEDPTEQPEGVEPHIKGTPGNIRQEQRAMGRRSKADNPLVGMLDQAYRLIDKAEKNLAYHGLNRMLAALPPDARKELGITMNKGRSKRVINKSTGLVQHVDDSFDRTRQNAVHMLYKGQPHYIVFDDQRLAEGVRRWSPYSNRGIALANHWLSKWKSLLTHYNPEFMGRHAARYFVEGLVNSLEQREHGPYSASRYFTEAFPIIGGATRAIFNVERGKEGGKLGEYWKEMKKGGGSTSLFSIRDYDQMLERLSEQASRIGKATHNPRAWARAVSEAVDKYTSILDNSTRLAAYGQARDAGKSVQQASMIAREATIDYNLRGVWSNAMAIWAPFFNVATQTGYRMAAAGQRSSTMRKAFLGVVALGIGAAIWNYAFGGKDSDKVPFFDKIAEWTKSKNFIAYVPGLTDDKGRPQPVMWPFPYNFAAPLTLGYGLVGMFMGNQKQNYSKNGAMVFKAFLSAFSQVGEEGVAWRDLSPELLRPFMDIALNKSWTGSHVHTPDEFAKGPNARSGFRDTAEIYKDVAKFINNYSGGAPNRSGVFDLHPEDIQYILKSFFGGQVRPLSGAIQAGQDISAGESPKPSDIPISRVFFGTDYDKADKAATRERVWQSKHPWDRPILP